MLNDKTNGVGATTVASTLFVCVETLIRIIQYGPGNHFVSKIAVLLTKCKAKGGFK